MVAGTVLAPTGAPAATYAVRVHWQPSGDAGVVGYRIYTRRAGGAFGLALDAGLPAPAADATLAAIVGGLAPCTTYGVAVTSYAAGGIEGVRSNEVTVDYATVAPLIDSDRDGLSNAVEDANLNCVVDPGETDPDRPDTDGDGVGDAQDRCRGTAAGAPVNASGCSCAQIGCDDGNPCTTDVCTAGQCAHVAAANGTSCDDGLFCNGAETCRRGVCTPGAPLACDDGNVCTRDACDESRRRCTHAAVAGCCVRDADCPVADACHANPRCAAGRCLSDLVVCPDPGPCAGASCDPRAGCQTTLVPDGTPCDDGDACTVNDVCTGGACGGGTLHASALVDGAGPTLTRLSMRTTARGVGVSARATFPAPSGVGDLAGGEVHVELHDAAGATLMDTTVAGARFVGRGAGRALYRDDHRAEGGGFTSIELAARGGRGWLMLYASIPPAPQATAAGLETLRTPTVPSATLDWQVRSGNTCAKGSGQCNGRVRRCR